MFYVLIPPTPRITLVVVEGCRGVWKAVDGVWKGVEDG